MNKIVFFDIDGTIIDTKRLLMNVSKKTRYAFEYLKRNGDYVFISSGRSRCMMSKEMVELNPSGFIYCNGACVELHKKIIYSLPMNKDKIKILKDYCDNHDGVYFLESLDEIVVKDNEAELIKQFNKSWNVTFKYLNDDNEDRDYYLCMTMFKTPKASIQFEKDLSSILDINQQNGYLSIDVNDKGVNKGLGVKKILDYLRIDKKDAYAFGDGINDIEMLESVGHGVMMGNAQEPLLKYDFEKTDDVIDDGVYNYLVKNGIIKPLA